MLCGGKAKRGDVEEGFFVAKLNQEQPPLAAGEAALAHIKGPEVRHVAEEIEQLPVDVEKPRHVNVNACELVSVVVHRLSIPFNVTAFCASASGGLRLQRHLEDLQ